MLKDILYFYHNALRIILHIYINIFYHIVPYSFHFFLSPYTTCENKNVKR